MIVDSSQREMLEGIPAELIAGDTWKWSSSFADYSAADGWSLTTSFRGASSLDVEGEAESNGFISIGSAEDTEPLTPGRYSWASRVLKDDEVFTVATGVVEVLAGLSSITGEHDGRSISEKQLAAVETNIEALLSKQHSSVSFGDQSYTLQDVEKLMKIRDRLREQVATEKRQANGGKGRRILIEFGGL